MVLESVQDTSSIKYKLILIKNYIRTRTPGLLDILNTQTIHTYGKDVFTLLLESPCIVYNIINSISKDKTIARYILVYVLLKPLIGMLDRNAQQKLYNDIAKCTDLNLDNVDNR